MNIETITEQALKLEPALRAYVAEILLESLDYEEDFNVSVAWRQEIKKRCDEIDADPSILIDGGSFMAELRQRYL
ncbi:addiction module component, TIGR02574 family [Methyloglobulus morosus KoM1]|uniref:Addiction module component, TIGR02574 family n=1 Tax=Methyloglobulus morosus KoM1 TaxID=1116472 RepID=V5C1X0_9GAMM|nr:addiction module protein [Methyloglobulus morosus]ESS70803.1 addiction module component, TIGR02574 family [Methyloglobulus morosus KoM1]